MAVQNFKKFLPAIALLALTSCGGSTQVQERNGSQATAASPAVATTTATTPASGATKQLTPAENNALVARVYNTAWNDGNLAILDEYITPDGLDHSPLSTEKGTAGFKKIIQTFRDAMPNLKLTIEDEIYAGDKVVHRWKVQGTHTGKPLFGVPASGKERTLTGISILRLENGKIAERWAQLDQFGLSQQLGLIPPPKAAARQ